MDESELRELEITSFNPHHRGLLILTDDVLAFGAGAASFNPHHRGLLILTKEVMMPETDLDPRFNPHHRGLLILTKAHFPKIKRSPISFQSPSSGIIDSY